MSESIQEYRRFRDRGSFSLRSRSAAALLAIGLSASLSGCASASGPVDAKSSYTPATTAVDLRSSQTPVETQPPIPTKRSVAPRSKNVRPPKDVLEHPKHESAYKTSGGYYRYADGSQWISNATGASARFDYARPYIDKLTSSHSLTELALSDATTKQVIEVGWIVGSPNEDYEPHLFTYRWADGVGACYNACGFVPEPGAKIQPGSELPDKKSHSYGIKHSDTDHQWNILFDGRPIGHYPDELWDGNYTRAGLVQVFGEVVSDTDKTCTDMGNGSYGSAKHATRIGNYMLYGTTTKPNLTIEPTNPRLYSTGNVSPTGFTFGGPGQC